jgi:O-antigen ligase
LATGSQSRDLPRWIAYFGFALSLTLAALLNGGVDPSQWQWIAVIVSLSSCLCLAVQSKRTKDVRRSPELVILGALLLWMLFQLVPLPSALIASLSPHRWDSALAARLATGSPLNAWLPFSVAPAATLERLLYVVPAMAAFVAAREMGRWWGGRRLWIIVAPVIAVALIECWFGLDQFFSAQAASPDPQVVRGTYVNRNHFAGLLELALPLAIMWAIAILYKAKKRGGEVPAGAAIKSSLLLAIAAALLTMVMASLSRMGFIASLSAIAVAALGWLILRREADHASTPKWLWLIPVILPLGVFALFSTNAMVLRFADTPGAGEITSDGRMQIWSESLRLIGAYKWTGTGLGAFEQGLYPLRHFSPDFTFDFAHNDYLQILAELGVIGGFLAIALAARVLWKPISVILDSGSRHRALAVGLVGAMLAIGLHSLVDFNLYIPANALAVAWLAGLAVSPGLQETE